MRIYLMMILVVVFSSCVRNKNGQAVQTVAPSNTNVFEVTEVIQGSQYTYLKVKENMSEKWVATAKTEANIGDVLYYDEALQMNNFHSKELDRDFDEIYFINQVSENPIADQMRIQPPHNGKIESKAKSDISLNKSEDELTVAEIFANPNEYTGDEIQIKGVVVKVNNEIMGKNWVHIQDGTSNEGNFDFTVTTTDKVEVNDVVTFKGKISLEKDFGSGYYYDVIMEDATLVSKEMSQL